MCGVHSVDGSPIGHEHEHGHDHGKIFYPRARAKSRRAFLGEVGKGTVALAVVSPAVLSACSSGEPTGASPGATTSAPSTVAESDPAASTPTTSAVDSEPAATDELRWGRANLGFVSAYVLARGNKATIVDTGNPGSADAIGETLATLGLNYSDVEHVVLTHNHGDHAGSIDAVLAAAINATAYAGEADLSDLSNSDIVGLTGGEEVFGLEAVASPGHTPGHMSVIDHDAGLLVAGDAVWTENGGVIAGPDRFNTDTAEALETVKALAQLSFNTLLVGHGDPIEMNADTALVDLADSLG